MKQVAVIDIGKTNVKLALVDTERMTEQSVVTMPNIVRPAPPYPHFDADAIWTFVKAGLSKLARENRIDGISVTTHGACGAFLAADGSLATPVLDYEFNGPDRCRAAYDAIRPPFSQTGSPALPLGLNLGAQLFWLLGNDTGLRHRAKSFVTWPQYWGYLLTGALACDHCSLGCHTDLWNPSDQAWSDLPARLGLEDIMSSPRRPAEILGHLRKELQEELGLADIPVLVGIHDSNASLLPHLMQRESPFAVVSTGTWVISMAIGGKATRLDPTRDTLVNVNAEGVPVPSARFMGGREYDLVVKTASNRATDADADAVLRRKTMLLPAIVPESGPFQGRRWSWIGAPESTAQAEVAIGYYLALMTAECLSLIGAEGPVVVEGPFTKNHWFKTMLSSATGRQVIASSSRTGTAIGAALLFQPGLARATERGEISEDLRLQDYAAAWRQAVQPVS